MEPQTFSRPILKQVEYRYLLHIPPGPQPAAGWPTILFLHGVGERGYDLEKVKRYGIPQRVEADPAFPFLVIAPQCLMGSRWITELDGLNALLEDAAARYPVDRQRIYLTGMSMGGYGAWHLAIEFPDWFAALAPLCGGGDPARAGRLRSIPTWAFHGAEDATVPLQESQEMAAALAACGGDVRLTVYPHTGHDCWTAAYADPELYAWFLSHKKEPTPS